MSKKVRSEWHGPNRKRDIRDEMKKRLQACAIHVSGFSKRLISTQGTINTNAPTRDSKGRFQRKYGSNPSQPGDPPHKQTGRLRASVTWEFVGTIARVGTNVLYGRWLELGTKKMAARPWLRRSLDACQAFIKARLSKPMN